MTARRTRHPWPVMLAFAAAIGGAPFHAQDRQEPRESTGDRKEKKELPLKPDRTIAFDTSEGSWISLDVAPDGRSIVFELLGDLYTLPIEGGSATRITSGLMSIRSRAIRLTAQRSCSFPIAAATRTSGSPIATAAIRNL